MAQASLATASLKRKRAPKLSRIIFLENRISVTQNMFSELISQYFLLECIFSGNLPTRGYKESCTACPNWPAIISGTVAFKLVTDRHCRGIFLKGGYQEGGIPHRHERYNGLSAMVS